jgi:hypothetical protein
MSTGDLVRRESNIGPHSRVTVAVLCSAVSLAVMGTVYWMQLRGAIHSLQESQWTIRDQGYWSMKFQKDNPTINVPIPTIPENVEPTFFAVSNAVFAVSSHGIR